MVIVMFPTWREADAFRLDIENQLRGGTFRPDGEKITVKEAADLFLTYCQTRMNRRERMTRRNYETYAGHIRNYICPRRHKDKKRTARLRPFDGGIGAVTLRKVTARAIGDLRDRLRDAGVSVPITRKILGTLQLVLGHAVGRDLVAVNVAKGVRVGRTPRRRLQEDRSPEQGGDATPDRGCRQGFSGAIGRRHCHRHPRGRVSRIALAAH